MGLRLFGKIDGKISPEDRPFFYSGIFTGIGWMTEAEEITDWDKTDKTDADWEVASRQTRVTGNPAPDCNGTYVIGGQHNGEDFYQREDAAWFVWWDGSVSWVISQEVGALGSVSWFRVSTNILGDYLWGLGASGTPTVGLHLPDTIWSAINKQTATWSVKDKQTTVWR